MIPSKHSSFFLFLSFAAFSPLSLLAANLTSHVSLNWNGTTKVLTEENEGLVRLNFSGAVFSKETGYNPSKTFFIENLASGSFRISDEVFMPLTAGEITLINESRLPANIQIGYSDGLQNGQPLTRIEILALRKNANTGQIEKLVSFVYTYDQQRTNRFGRTMGSMAFGASNSLLATGDWYKISVGANGIYKIDYAMLQSMGINPSSINPKNIRLYGNGGGMLPQPNASSRVDDVLENAIKVVGEEDNTFDAGDYILFYGQSPDKWAFDTNKQLFYHTKNLYSDVTHYFLSVSGPPGTRVQDASSSGSGSATISVFDDRQFHEKDIINVIHSGRDWYGELFDYQPTQSFSFPINTFDPNGRLTVQTSVLTKAGSGQTSKNFFGLTLNGSPFGSVSGFGRMGDQFSNVGINTLGTSTANIASLPGMSSMSLGLTYNNSGSPAVSGYLNYIEVNVSRPLSFQGLQQGFRSIASKDMASVQYSITNTYSNLSLWDVTDPFKPINQSLIAGVGGATCSANPNGLIREYIMFNGSDYLVPTFVKKVANQNLHAIDAPYIPDLVIVTDVSLRDAADRLASFRESHDGMSVKVVTTEEIYNEFSSGSQDVSAIRDFMRFLYKRGTSTDSVRYLCLFGACSYDYKNRVSDNTNLVPVYETYNSLHTIWSFSSDDYFGLLDDLEGEWSEISIKNEALDIGIGRLPVRNSTEAQAMVDKIISYHTNRSSLGNWRSKVSFVADAGDGNLHQTDANLLADDIKTRVPYLNINKLFVDSYQWITFPDGVRAPACNEAITKGIQQGTFLFNYTGHGNETQLSGYNVFNKNMVQGFTNMDQLPFGVFATCEFGRYDDPAIFSGAQAFVLSPQGGAIGVFNSTRPVYSNSNYAINSAFYGIVFKKTNGTYPRLGDIYKYSKNTSSFGLNNRNYAILGDPSMRLEYPEQNIVVTHFNGMVKTDSVLDTLRALSKVTFGGEIRDQNNILSSNFNGQLNITIFDKENRVNTLGQKGAGNEAMPYFTRTNSIYNGIVTVSSGGFNVTLVIPKDISYVYGTGKLSLYASDDQSSVDAGGYNSKFIIGGSNPNARADNTPPRIQLFMNDESFVHGGFTSANPLFIAKIFDENGINVSTSSIGHEITGALSTNKANTVIMNDYYKTDLNTYQSGRVKYPYKDLAQGTNAVTFKAWDTYNNSSEAYLEFVVANNQEVAIKNLLNYPNPFTTHTTFHFDHNKPGDDLEMTVQIFTISGRLVRTLTGLSVSSSSHISAISWNGHDDFETEIGKGVYVYKLTVRSTMDGSETHQYEKLVILN